MDRSSSARGRPRPDIDDTADRPPPSTCTRPIRSLRHNAVREGRTVAYLHDPPRQSSPSDGHVFAPDLWRSLSSVAEGSDSGAARGRDAMRFIGMPSRSTRGGAADRSDVQREGLRCRSQLSNASGEFRGGSFGLRAGVLWPYGRGENGLPSRATIAVCLRGGCVLPLSSGHQLA